MALEGRGTTQVELERGVQAPRVLRPGTEWGRRGMVGPGLGRHLDSERTVRVEVLRWVPMQARGGLVQKGEKPGALVRPVRQQRVAGVGCRVSVGRSLA